MSARTVFPFRVHPQALPAPAETTETLAPGGKVDPATLIEVPAEIDADAETETPAEPASGLVSMAKKAATGGRKGAQGISDADAMLSDTDDASDETPPPL